MKLRHCTGVQNARRKNITGVRTIEIEGPPRLVFEPHASQINETYSGYSNPLTLEDSNRM